MSFVLLFAGAFVGYLLLSWLHCLFIGYFICVGFDVLVVLMD